jgi:hypothetical protein
MMRLNVMLITAVLLVSAIPAAVAKDHRPLFDDDTVLDLTLSGPIGEISRKPDAAPVPGVLKVEGASPETLSIALTTRGMTRRMPQICAFPPLRIIFSEKPAKTSLFRGQKALKLVTHCQGPERFEQGVLLEYDAYRLYRLMTDQSFGARLAKVNYTDNAGHPVTTRMGFFLEDINDVAKRADRKRFRGANRISETQLDPTAAARFAVFEYMISNLDWAMTAGQPGQDCCHNSRLLAVPGTATGLVGVPYDFDYSGLVDASYAVPPDGINVSSVRVRRYRGFCAHNEQAKAVMTDVLARRATFMAVINQTPGLSNYYRDKADGYMGEFFEQIASPQDVDRMMEYCLR